jgi:beta-glucosidase
VKVRNKGARKGSDVVQVYVADPESAQEPPSQLKGFEKVSLNPNESKTVRVDIPLKSLATWDENTNDWKLWEGSYDFKVGESSRQILLHSELELGSERTNLR